MNAWSTPLAILRLIATCLVPLSPSSHPFSSHISSQRSKLCLVERLEMEGFAMCLSSFHVTGSRAQSLCHWHASGWAWNVVLTWVLRRRCLDIISLPVQNSFAITSLKLRLQTNSDSYLGLKSPDKSRLKLLPPSKRRSRYSPWFWWDSRQSVCSVFWKSTNQTLNTLVTPFQVAFISLTILHAFYHISWTLLLSCSIHIAFGSIDVGFQS